MKKALIRCVLLLILALALAPCAGAEDSSAARAESEYQGFLDALPPELVQAMPDSLADMETGEGEEALREAGNVRTVLRTVGKLTGLALRENLALLAGICGLLVLSAVFRALSPDKKGGVGEALSFCSTLCLCALLLSMQSDRFEQIEVYFDTVKGLSTAFLPLMGTLYAMGGNIRAAAVNHSVLSAFLALLETLCAGTVVPIAGICLALALLDAIAGGGISLRPLSNLIKRTYTLSLSFLMLLLCGVLGSHSMLAKAGDTLTLRTARFAAGSFLPVVGGSVSETLRTVAGGVEYLRGVAGTGAILALFFTFLPTLLSVLLTRVTFCASGAVAKLLHATNEEKILAELASVYGYFLAVIASVFVMLVCSLTVFTRCAAAG